MAHPTHPRRRRTATLWLTVMVIGLSVILAGCGGSSVSVTPAAQVAATATDIPATATPVPPTDTPSPPTDTLVPAPTDAPSPTGTPTATPATADAPGFAADIQPIFTGSCVKCHSGDNAPRGLQLNSYAGVIAGGTYRPVIVPGNAAESELVKRIKGEAIPRMPFDGPPFLSENEIALIIAWIEAGAPDN